jgi:sulfur relay (sulfurtransferase) DsrF/TusC family protein
VHQYFLPSELEGLTTILNLFSHCSVFHLFFVVDGVVGSTEHFKDRKTSFAKTEM